MADWGWFLLTGGILFAGLSPSWVRRYRVWRWRRHLRLAEHGRAFGSLFEDINGFVLSMESRKERDAFEYTYGEICFEPFIALMSQTSMSSDSVFLDLGSGAGKAVLAVAMVFGVSESRGIECFPALVDASEHARKNLAAMPDYQDVSGRICFECANFLEADIADATHVFINSTAMFGEPWEALARKLGTVQPGCIVVTTSKDLPSPDFRLLQETRVRMSWGVVRAFLQVRQ